MIRSGASLRLGPTELGLEGLGPRGSGQIELCFGENHGDQIARGYLTIDDVQRCALVFPSDEGYFGFDDPVASNDNQLWAEVWLTCHPGLDGALRGGGHRRAAGSRSPVVQIVAPTPH